MAIYYKESSEWKKTLEDGTEVIRTCAWSPPGCHGVGCGLRLYVKNGELVKVEGDPEHPLTRGKLCVRCLALKEYIYHPDRLKYPMKRAGRRGENKWERISWDEAFDIIIAKTKEIAAKYGPESIIVFCGTGRQAVRFQYALATMALGTPNVCYSQSGWSCKGPRDTAVLYLLGSGYTEFDYAAGLPGRYDDPEFVLPKYVLLWGKEPLRSNADGTWGHALIEMMKRGTKVIMVDPRMNWLATRAEHVLQLRPGTDTALALALLHVVINEGLYDREFVEKWTHGFEELKQRVQQYPPSWAAKVTEVPEEQIVEVARILGTAKPWGLCMGLACDQNPNGVQLVHALLALVGITGNLDVPGGTVVGKPMLMDFGTNAPLPQELMDKVIGQKEYPALALLLNTTHPDLTLDTLETGKPYELKMAWISSTNLLAPTNSAQPKRWYDALRKLEFCVATDTFFNPTIMALADIVLPLSTFAEHDGIVLNHQGGTMGIIGAINKAIKVGECKSDLEIVLELGKRINPEAFTGEKWENPEKYLDNELKSLGMTFNELREKVCVQQHIQYYKHEKGLNRPDGQPGFNTTTGKLELYSLMLEALGEDPLPYYEEPRFSPISRPDLAKEYPLTLTTGARYYAYFHSEQRQIPSLRELVPDPLVEIHPETAAKLGIKDGDWVWIENLWGRCKQKAKITPIVKPNVVAAAHGWWFPEKEADAPSLYGVWEANVNCLIPHKEIGKLGFGAYYKCIPCKIYKAD
ncbi:MAG: molybdopterin-dependent oxidoreductase [Moorellaceae bacterium]